MIFLMKISPLFLHFLIKVSEIFFFIHIFFFSRQFFPRPVLRRIVEFVRDHLIKDNENNMPNRRCGLICSNYFKISIN